MTTHKEKIEIEVDVRDGFRIKRYGCPGETDLVMNDNGIVFKPHRNFRDTNFWIVEPIPEPYVFPDWMPDGSELALRNDRWWLYVNGCPCPMDYFPKFVPPTDAQYAGKPMKVTH